ncbi:hypothetical protein F9L33_08215 [Amylibacter sp. SFDW26]|uniref:DUF6478 family protein n=1 Tax=Amylibacter sp. SFDW26 TaxID=2652722 RepID=UPI001261B00F|nr:DUF6478 family protein [Amylibacter sp. SFDW26]KAB7614611.1 hypothetical protein F9L33_08215 [Amylibacter sp. SFDW26]
MGKIRTLIDEWRNDRSLKWWDRKADSAETMDLADLRDLRTEARQFRNRVNKINHIASSRLTLPVIGSKAIKKPQGTEWAHRPEAWAGPVSPTGMSSIKSKARIGSELAIFHDCESSELTLRQVRNSNEEDLAPFGIRLDVFSFQGSFLSLAVEMPRSAIENLKREHIIRLTLIIDSERPQEMFARLNLRHGPNTEQIVRELDFSTRELFVEFDLFYTKFKETRAESLWFDLIFESPSMNQITIRDVSVIRRRRANT